MKNSFVLQTRLNAVVSKLSDKQAGVLFKSIMNYAENGAVANFEDSAVSIAFEFVRQDLDYAAQKYAETCARRAEAGQKGGLAKVANASKCLKIVAKPSKAKHIDNDVDTDTDIKKLLTAAKPPQEKKLNTLQEFSNQVIAEFEDLQTDTQKAIWFKRNSRCLSDILNFCGKDIPLALETIRICAEKLAKAGYEGGYEAVCRNLSTYHRVALERLKLKGVNYAQ